MNDVGHSEAYRASVTQVRDASRVDTVDIREVREGVVVRLHAAVDYLRIHARAADVLADLIHDQDVDLRCGSFAIQDFTSARMASSRAMTSALPFEKSTAINPAVSW